MSKYCNYGDNGDNLTLILWSSSQAQAFHKSHHAKQSIPVVAAQLFENNLLTSMFSHVCQLVMLEKLK